MLIFFQNANAYNSITVKDIQKFTDDLFKQKNEIEVSMISPETPDKE